VSGKSVAASLKESRLCFEVDQILDHEVAIIDWQS
jgi:hypothetical protein